MKGEKTFLIVDQGGHATRSMVMDGTGKNVAWSEQPLKTLHSRQGFVEHDPLHLIQTIRRSLAELAGKWPLTGKTVSAAGFATQRSSIVCWDSDTGEALSPVISWQDTRAAGLISRLSAHANQVHSRTGLFLSPHYGASKMAWCLENLPAVRDAEKDGRLCFGPMSSFIVWQLTHERRFLADPVSASRTLLWNIRQKDWDPNLLGMFEVPSSALPTCVPTVHNFGALDLDGERIPLRLVTGDQSAAMYAFGNLQPQTAYVNMGTGAFVSRVLGHQPELGRRLLTSVLHEQDGRSEYVLEGTVNGAGSAVKWAQDAWGIKDLRQLLPGWLEETTDPPLFLNGISGLGSPYWVPDFTSVFVGESGVPGKVAAVVESIAFLLNRNIVEMGLHLKPPERIQVTGGLSAIEGLCQGLADLTGVPVYRPAQVEATTRGTCYLLAGRPEQWPEPVTGKLFEPDIGSSITGRYERWLEEMEKRIEAVNGEQ